MALNGRERLAVALGAVAVTCAVLVGGQRLIQAIRPQLPPVEAAAPDLRSPTDRQISSLQALVRADANDEPHTVLLGQAYLQKARESGDPAYYPLAESAFQRAIELKPNDYMAMVGMGSLAMSRHQFRDGLDWGMKARAATPKPTAVVLGLMGDAQIELGQYPEAVSTFQAMVDLRPDQASYSRASYARELHGYVPQAIDAMKQAVAAGPPGQEGTAWARVQLGNLYFNSGDLTAAQAAYQASLQDVPDYLHGLAGLAKVEAARGHYDSSIALYKRTTEKVPLAEYVIALGDVYQASGRSDEANQQYQLVGAIQQLSAANGVDMDLELALFDLDHDRDPAKALATARAQVEKRPSIKAQDTLAWALFKTGDCQSARLAMDQALRLGTKDSLMFFHAGMISQCAGQTGQARSFLDQAIKINPNFSVLYSDRARQTLAQLDATGAAASALPERGS